jgi:hypothetical protein
MNGFYTVVAATMLLSICLVCGIGEVQKIHYRAIDLADTINEEFASYSHDRLAVLLSEADTVEEVNTLLAWTRAWPGQLERYHQSRQISPEHHISNLSGFHRDLWKHFDYPVKIKQDVFEGYKDYPDNACTPEARVKHGQDFIMPSNDSHFLRKTICLCPESCYSAFNFCA